jgi:hypothetical protein
MAIFLHGWVYALVSSNAAASAVTCVCVVVALLCA